ncbi:hypothetical protein [Actinomyces mediterranea]|uniref:hypothetical protein n=1 Tax=Actinomyces mediterranea TaxID=1871028 RepID=UPI0009708230|nr:hypothetical protein [Actinomyces mediterranea]
MRNDAEADDHEQAGGPDEDGIDGRYGSLPADGRLFKAVNGQELRTGLRGLKRGRRCRGRRRCGLFLLFFPDIGRVRGRRLIRGLGRCWRGLGR